MAHSFRVHEVRRWLDLNEYEGEVAGELDGRPVVAYFQGADEDEWAVFAPGAEVTVTALVERLGEVRTLPAGTPPALEQTGRHGCVFVGVVESREGESLFVRSVLDLAVDLDVVRDLVLPPIDVGDVVWVQGALTVELPD